MVTEAKLHVSSETCIVFMYMQIIRFYPVEEQAKRYGDVNLIVQINF